MNRFCFLIFMVYGFSMLSQNEKPPASEKPPFDRKEEILYDNKRYRIHNNYITLGAGYNVSSIREDVQQSVNADFQFHIRRHQFQFGAMMSGQEFFSNNNTQLHLGYGLRKETNTANLAVFGGPTYFTGVQGSVGQPATFYDGFGVYVCGQAVYKLTYDIGIGVELFVETSYKQSIGGVKFIAFFSGAYRGVKKKFNPNVKSQSGS